MDDIQPPKLGSSDRFLECQEAIEARVRNILEDAYVAGWEHGEVLAAIIHVADEVALMLGEKDALQDLLMRLRDNQPGDD